MSHDWQTTDDMRYLAEVTDERLAKGPRWARGYIAALERRLAEARFVADELTTPIEPAPGVVEVQDRCSGAVVRFRPGARARIYIGDRDDYRSRFEIRADRQGDSIEIMGPDTRRLAALGTGGVNTMTILALED